MINRVVLVGRLTKDPEFRTTPSGANIANFTLAVIELLQMHKVNEKQILSM